MNRSFFTISLFTLLCWNSFLKKESAGHVYVDQWTGYVHYSYTMIDKGDRDEAGSKTEWNSLRDASMFIRVNNNIGWAHVNDRLSRWQRTTITEQNAQPSIQIIKSAEVGEGSGSITVSVDMDNETGKYWLKMDGPRYPVHKVDSMIQTFAGTPIVQSGSGSFDIRLLPQINAEISNKDQFMTMPCTNGRTGEFAIGPYHRSASTTLVAIAVLEDGRRIKGNLLRSGGITEIPIPKTNTP